MFDDKTMISHKIEKGYIKVFIKQRLSNHNLFCIKFWTNGSLVKKH